MRRPSRLLEELDRQHKLSVRVAVYLTVNPGSTPDAIDKILELRQASRDPMVRIAGVDMVLDGQMEAHSAALLEPYANEAGVSGKAMWSQEAFNEMATLCDSGGLQISIHAVGDRAVRMALDGFEAVRRADEAHDSRFRIEQAELVAPADMARFARLGAIAAMIPAHADPGGVDGWSRAVGRGAGEARRFHGTRWSRRARGWCSEATGLPPSAPIRCAESTSR
jgi:predicted amidohydrolase YtcJ